MSVEGDEGLADQPKLRVMDGFMVPGQIEDELADSLLSEYHENSQRIAALCESDLKKGLFFGVDEEDREEREQEVLLLMARNYTLIEQLQGHETLSACGVPEKLTIRDCLSQRFADAFPSSEA